MCDGARPVDCSFRLIEGGLELHAITVRQKWRSGLAAVDTVHTGNCTEGMSNLCVFSIQSVIRKQTQAHIDTHARTHAHSPSVVLQSLIVNAVGEVLVVFIARIIRNA